MKFFKKLLKTIAKIFFISFLLLMVFFAINSHLELYGDVRTIILFIMAGILLVILGYIYYLNKYKY